LVVVADTFHTRPLIHYLNTNKHFFLLALSKKSVAFYEGDDHGMTRLEVDTLPRQLSDVARGGTGRPYLGVHGALAQAKSPVFHGQGRGRRARGDLDRFFRAIDRALWPVLHDETAPLLLAGVAEHQASYRAICRYPEVLEEGVEGNVDRTPLRELHARALAILRRSRREIESAVVTQVNGALGSGRAATDLREIAEAAAHGRVRLLVHARGEHVWGKLNRSTGEVEIRDLQRDAEDADLIDDLSEAVLLRGGDVFELPAGKLPSPSPVAAIYRY
jgi:hypothetical protein